MGYREVAVEEIREVLRLWLGLAVGLPSPGLRTIAAHAGVDRKTVRRYLAAAHAAGVTRESGAAGLTDEVIGQIVAAVRPARPNGHGQSWELLVPFTTQIRDWVAGSEESKPLTVNKIHELLGRQGCVVPYRTLVRFATEECGYRRTATSMRVADGEPEVECQLDFGYLGMLTDPQTGRRRKVHALVLTAVYSRHTFVWLTHSQTLAAVIAGCEAAWEFFGGVFAVLIPDNMKPVVTQANKLKPQLGRGWLGITPSMPDSSPTPLGYARRPTSHGWNARSISCRTTSGPARTSPACLRRRLRPRCGVPGEPVYVFTAPPRWRQQWCSPATKHPGCCRYQPPTMCRSSHGGRYTKTFTPQSARRCTRCPKHGSAPSSMCAPTASV
ncbi:hypothetical protein [Gordonia sp. N1V]|uniref:hypothetical protein n=1 Tax=Gordonia sp. N1V TaxID=3034163 RepID=UPI0031FEBFF6